MTGLAERITARIRRAAAVTVPPVVPATPPAARGNLLATVPGRAHPAGLPADAYDMDARHWRPVHLAGRRS